MTTATVETITPELASQYLLLNTSNRSLRKNRVDQYASAMARGEWVLTGEPLIFNGTKLVNGQHRLSACVQSGSAFTSVVVRGVTDDAYSVMDSGLPRTMGDVLSHHGIPSFNQVAAVTRLVLAYRHGVVHDPQRLALIASRPVVLADVTENADVYNEAVRRWGSERFRVIGFNRTATAAFWMLAGASEMASHFLDSTCTGANLEEGDPRLTLRNWAPNASNRTAPIHLSAIIRAWNAYSKNEALKNIKPWFKGSPFPRLDGGK